MAGGLGWTDTEIASGSGELIVSVAIPFHLPDRPGAAAGVVRLSASIRHLRDTVSTFTAGRTRYGYLLSSLGTYVSHPIERYVAEQRTLFEVAQAHGKNGSSIECVRQAMAGGDGFSVSRSELTGRDAWMLCEPIPTTGWVLVLVSEQAE